MAAMDFMHKQLISAAGRDALTSMGAGAGIGAGVGAANALVTGNDSLLGGATSGAMLGAGAGAAMRYAGAKYGSGLMAGAKAGDDTGKFSTTFFTKATKDDDILSFMGSSEDAGKMKGFADAAANQAAAKAASKGGAANAAGTPTAGAVKTNAPKNISQAATDMVNEGNAKDAIDATKKLRAEQAEARTAHQTAPLINKAPSNRRSYGDKAQTRAEKAKGQALLENRAPTIGMEDYNDKGFMGDVPQYQLQYLNNTYAPKLNNEEIRKGIVAKNASKIREPGYTSKQEINEQWNNRASEKEAQMNAMWESIGM